MSAGVQLAIGEFTYPESKSYVTIGHCLRNFITFFTTFLYCSELYIFYYHQMSMGLSSVSNMEPTQLNLLLPTTVVCTFPLFNAWFDIVYFAIIIFQFPFAISRPPDGQVVVCIR